MLRVTLSNRLEELAASLAEALPADDPFARPTIVVSGRLVARWLQYDLARRRGVAAALDLPSLEAFLDRTLTGDADARAAGLVGLDRPRLAALVASALADDALIAEPAMAPARGYLDADGDPDARAVRRTQLAARVAAHLWDYALTRPRWLDAWDAGRPADTGEVDAATLAWQRRLYDVVLGPTGTAARLAGADGAAVVAAPIPRLIQARKRLGLPPARVGGPVHLIGFSYLARAHVDALGALAEHDDVHLAIVTPCAEYWADVPGRRRGAPVGDDPLALVLWGRPGRDTSSMLVSATEGDVAERHVDTDDRGTAVAAWAHDVLHRVPPLTAPLAEPPPPGLRVLACPSVARELEIVGSDIWRRLDADPTLRASDVAVLVASDHDRYLAQLGPVFGGLHRLPFHVVDAPAAGPGRVAEAAALLLELPRGHFTRRELLAVMTHPSVLARHPHVDPADWITWCEHLGIARGADEHDHRGTYLDGADGRDAFHWSQGLHRLALGAFVAGPRAGVDAPVRTAGRELLAEELAPDQHASAATFALLARSLIADARWLASRTEPLTRWAEILAAVVDTYTGVPGDADPDDAVARERTRVLDQLRGVADLDLDRRAVPYAEALELAAGRLETLREGRGEPLAHGVLVAPLEPMRPLPAPLVYVIGLGEGLFPSGEQPSPLDLRGDHQLGDVSLRDRDRYGFLEALLAARGDVTLSYVARDELTGEPRAPSSVIHELADALAPYLGVDGGAAALAALTVPHPLRRWDDRYLTDPRLTASVAPAAHRERHAVAVRAALDEHLRAVGRAAPDAARLRELLAAHQLAELRGALRLDLADGVPPPAVDDAPLQLSLAALRRFLEAPVQAWAQVVLHLFDDGADDLAEHALREDEPFDPTGLSRAMLRRDAFARALADGAGADGLPTAAALDAAYAAARHRAALAGQVPLGVFGEVAARVDLAQLHRWRDAIEDRQLRGPWTRLAFGRATVDGARLERALAIDVELGDGDARRRRRVELVGTTELCCGDDLATSVILVNKVQAEHHLRHALDHLVLAAAGVTAGAARTGLVLGDKIDDKALAPWTADAARDHLALLIGELLEQRHAYLLPYRVALDVLAGKTPRLRHATDKVATSLGFGPLRRDDGLTLPPDAADLARRRLGPLLDRMIGGRR